MTHGHTPGPPESDSFVAVAAAAFFFPFLGRRFFTFIPLDFEPAATAFFASAFCSFCCAFATSALAFFFFAAAAHEVARAQALLGVLERRVRAAGDQLARHRDVPRRGVLSLIEFRFP